jgi:site-specific recombinase XerC
MAGGIRLSELVGLDLDDVNPASREATVTGKGDKRRAVRFIYDTLLR